MGATIQTSQATETVQNRPKKQGLSAHRSLKLLPGGGGTLIMLTKLSS